MSINIRFPNITASTEKEQITQIKSYLHQLVEQLNNELPNIGSGQETTQKTPNTYEVQGGELSYYEFRSLVIQQLQEVERLFEQLSEKVYDDMKNVANAALEEKIESVAQKTAEKISFTMDEDGNLYYEVEE